LRKIAQMVLVLSICVVSVIAGQKEDQHEKEHMFVVPRELVLNVVASNFNCPFEVLNPQTLGGVDSGSVQRFQLRNRGTKPIIYYKIAIVHSDGTEETRESRAAIRAGWIMPGQIESFGSGKNIEIVPLTDELRKQRKVDGKMRAINIFLVVRAEFADGTAYEDEQTYKSLKTLFEENAIVPDFK
jgi:hypothetical protein